MEQAARVELVLTAWEAIVLPLNYACIPSETKISDGKEYIMKGVGKSGGGSGNRTHDHRVKVCCLNRLGYTPIFCGASGENWTRTYSLEGCCSTIKLHLHASQIQAKLAFGLERNKEIKHEKIDTSGTGGGNRTRMQCASELKSDVSTSFTTPAYN